MSIGSTNNAVDHSVEAVCKLDPPPKSSSDQELINLACSLCNNPLISTIEKIDHIIVQMQFCMDGRFLLKHIRLNLADLRKRKVDLIPTSQLQLDCLGVRNKIAQLAYKLEFSTQTITLAKQLSIKCVNLMQLEKGSSDYNEQLQKIETFILQNKIFVNLCTVNDSKHKELFLDYYFQGKTTEYKKRTSLLYLCFIENHVGLVKLLARCGSDVGALSYITSKSDRFSSNKECIESIKAFFENGLEICAFLRNLSSKEQIDLVVALIGIGFNVDLALEKLVVSEWQLPMEIFQHLIEAGAKTNEETVHSTFNKAHHPHIIERLRLLIYNSTPINLNAIECQEKEKSRLLSCRRGDLFHEEDTSALQVLYEAITTRNEVLKEISIEVSHLFLKELSTISAFTKNPPEIRNIVLSYWLSQEDIAKEPFGRKRILERCRKKKDYI